jgi:hypothetical protein
VAREVAADVIVLEAHDHPRRHRLGATLAARVAQTATCSVLTIRDGRRARAWAPHPQTAAPRAPTTGP